MQLFRRALQRWEGYIKKSTGCRGYRIEPGPNGEFTLVLSDTRKSYRVHFSRRKVLGGTSSKPPMNQRMVKRTCDFVREIISDVKAERHAAGKTT